MKKPTRTLAFALGILCAGLTTAGDFAHALKASDALQKGSYYTLQVMTVPDRHTADKELKKLRARGLDPYVNEYTTQSGKTLYKIRLGRYTDRDSADAAAEAYKMAGGRSVLVIITRDDEPAPVQKPSKQKPPEQAQPASPTAVDDEVEQEPAAAAPPEATVTKEPSVEKKTMPPAPAGPEQEAGQPAQTTGEDRVKVTVSDKKRDPAAIMSLQEKIAALEKGQMPPEPEKQAAPDAPPPGTPWYTLQVSTEPDKKNASHWINQWSRKGYDAYCSPFPAKNGRIIYRIRIGRYLTAEEAGRASSEFEKKERKGSIVVKTTEPFDIDASVAQAPPSGDTAPQKVQEQEEAAPEEKKRTAGESAGQPPETAGDEPEDLEPEDEQALEPPPSHDDEEPSFVEKPDAQQPGKAPEAQPAAAAPAGTTKIYAFRQKSGALNLTNRYEDIPEEARGSIEYVSIFPVRILAVARNGAYITLDVEEQRKDVALAGVKIPGDSAPLRAYLESFKDRPLRMKYNPWKDDRSGTIAARLFLKEGVCINLEMIRKGLGACDPETLSVNQEPEFRQAESAAKKDRAGIWAN